MKVQILTNIPEFVTFKFNTWKRWDNQGQKGPYVTYSIGVEHKGLDNYLTVYEREYNETFAKLGNLQGRTLEIAKMQDGKYVNWVIKENGQDITPERSYSPQNSLVRPITPQTAPIPHQQPNQAPQPNFDTILITLRRDIAAGFKKRDDAIQELVDRVLKQEAQLSYFAFMFMQGNPDAFKAHADKLPEPKEPVEKEPVKNDEIPIIE